VALASWPRVLSGGNEEGAEAFHRVASQFEVEADALMVRDETFGTLA
jgi:hypothetical protein